MNSSLNHPAKKIVFEFFGQKLLLKSGDDPELVAEAVKIAEAQIEDAKKRSKNLVPYQVAVLALLDLAEEYVRAKRRSQKHRKQVEKKSIELLSLVEGELGLRTSSQA